MTGYANADEPLMDWFPWERYRQTVSHPCGYINAEDLERARGNIERYDWAEEYAKSIESRAQRYLDRFTPEFIETMIPATTPITCWQCPACRDKCLPRHPGGSWNWSLDDPEHIKCNLCGTVFPNDEYPETIVLQAKWGGGQTFSFYGGETFKQWGYPFYRPSFSGCVRVRKVNWCESMASAFAMAYALTGKPEYAEVTRKLLLRFAEVYPNWLLVSNYGEIADVDPHIAGLHIRDLPADELVYPPNKPDRALYAGYWASCRAGGGGQEGYFTRSILEAYSLTYNARKADSTPLYAEEDRIKIERDLILESCIHLIGEKNINNKSVGNRIAVGMVGMALGHPGFVRFGLEGFYKTIDEWFLEDGCTPESPGYAMMSLNGIYKMGQAVRGYSDPPGYVDENGERIENLNLYETKYKLVWQRMFEGMQGNLRYPPYADSYRSTEIGARFAELLAANYPDNPQYLALLREYAGNNLGKGDRETALFFRDFGLEEKESPPLTFHDVFFPVLCLGQLRTGEHGREALTLLSATHYGGHHHSDSLNLYYWKDGHELLTDLGYLWDHPMYRMTSRTFAHNTGMVDLYAQRTRGRDGRFHLFHTSDRVKVMEASSKAYDRADLYRRTVILIDHNPRNSYIVDIFRLSADGSRDLVYHGPNSDYKVQGIDLEPGDIASKDKEIPFGLRFHVTGIHDEIYVDDVAITLEDGTQLAVNPSASEIDEKTDKPVGWNHYSGDGEAEWGAASLGRTDDHCAYLRVTKGPVNQALIQGDTNGYTSLNALRMPAGKKGKVSFWIKGNAQGVNVGLVTWRGDPAYSGNRVHVDLCSVPVTDQWVHHSADFSVGTTVDLGNVKSADSSGTWTATWKIADDVQFTAHHCGQPGELVYIGDGWGQRDHRNTDLGVTIPYIVRRHQPERGVSTFCTLYEAHSPIEDALLKPFLERSEGSVRRLPTPDGYGDSIIAVEIQTTLGTDYLISQLKPAAVELDTPAGKLQTDARIAVASMRNGDLAFAAIAEGTTLSINGARVDATTLQPSHALAQQAAEASVEQ